MVSTILSNQTVRRLLLAIPILLALSLAYFRTFELYELQTYDWRCQLRIPRPMSDDIIFIHVGEDTLQKIGQWPISRKYHGALVRVLKEYGVKSVFFDFIFTEAKPEEDVELANDTAMAKNVYFGMAFTPPNLKKDRLISSKILSDLIPAYQQAARGVGFVNVVPDIDGKRRRVPLIISHESKDNYYVPFLLAIDSLGIDRANSVTFSKNTLTLSNGLTIPTNDDGYLLVSYAEKWGPKLFKHYSYADILVSYAQIADHEKPIIDLKTLSGKICFIGYTGTAMGDTNATPIDPIAPNFGIHANVLNTILQKDFIQRLDRAQNLLILMLLLMSVLYASLKMRPVASFRTVILSLLFYTVLVIFLFIRFGIWIDLFYPCALCVIVYAVTTLSRTLYEIKKRELIENELKVASQIQKSFLPPSVPVHQGLELAVYMKPAKAVGGDLYTFIPLSDEKMGVMLGDVSGKGTPAALFMAKAVSEFKFSAREKLDPSEVLAKLNNSIASESTGGLFVTLTYVIFDTIGKKLWMSNGGHLPVVCVEAGGQAEQLTSDGGMPIGVMEGIEFSKFEKELHDGDCYALYSDGVSEARNKKKEEFSIETLQKIMQENRGLSAQALLDTAIGRLNQFMGKADQHDDITLLIVKVGTHNG